MLAIAALIPAAFIGGYLLSDYLGKGEPDELVVEIDQEPVVETPIVQDGKPGNDDPKPVPASERIVVDGIGWYPYEEQVKVENSDPYYNLLSAFFSTTKGHEFIKKYSLSLIDLTTTRLGVVEVGEFKGYELREQYIFAGEMGGESIFFHTLVKTTESGRPYEEIYLKGSQYSSNCFGSCPVYGEIFSETELEQLSSGIHRWLLAADIEIPELAWGYGDIEVDGNTYYYTGRRGYLQGGKDIGDSYTKLIGKTNDDHELYSIDLTDENADYANAALVVKKKDGYMPYYEMKLPIWPDTQVTEQALIPNVIINGEPLSGQYAKTAVGGCGFTGVVRTVRQEDIPGLYEAGNVTGNASEKVYLADFTHESFDDEFASWSRMRSEEGTTREEFAKAIPAFYYKDAIGRWLRFDSLAVVPAGECGKPVIYLYPEETTDVSVQLDPQGGFTVTEPAYNSGWNVVAQPTGELTNKADGLTYPYLFWEGRGGLYSEPEKFWVVAKADVESFLVEKLSAFGFNAQEIADFNEFWLPRMEAAPWYKIGFHGTSVMDQIAPMSVSPAPDSVLRVLMDYSELQEPVAENPPSHIPSFKRDGFTVTEWGGVIR